MNVLMNVKASSVATVAVLLMAGIGLLSIQEDSNLRDHSLIAGSSGTVMDFAGREVLIPENLDDGIITVGRLSTLRWLAYFPDAMENVIMYDKGIKDALGTSGAAYTYAYKKELEDLPIHTNESMIDSEDMYKLKPSLILVNSDVYGNHKNRCDILARFFPLVVVDEMADLSQVGFWDSEFNLSQRFVDQADLYGKILKMEERGKEVKDIFQKHIDNIRGMVTPNDFTAYIAGPMYKGSHILNETFPEYIALNLAGGTNAYPSETKLDMLKLDIEEFGKLNFDTIFFDPSSADKLDSSQLALKSLYQKDVPIYIIIPSIHHGSNWDCVLAGAYYLAHIVNKTENTNEDIEILTKSVFTDFYGECGENIFDQMTEFFIEFGERSNNYTHLLEEVKVAFNGDKYCLVGIE